MQDHQNCTQLGLCHREGHCCSRYKVYSMDRKKVRDSNEVTRIQHKWLGEIPDYHAPLSGIKTILF